MHKKNNCLINRPRISCFHSNKHFYTQLILDRYHSTLVSCSTISKELQRLRMASAIDCYDVGRLLSLKAKKLGIREAFFSFKLHYIKGKIKSFLKGLKDTNFRIIKEPYEK